MDKIELHPSGISSFFDCSYRWFRDTLYKPIRRVGTAAHTGTGIHKASEVYYNECISNQQFVKPNSELPSVALDAFRAKIKDDEPSDLKDIDILAVENIIVESTRKYLADAPSINRGILPIATELNYKQELNSNIFSCISGTLDIVGKDYIVDIKTMSKMKSAKTYIIQQGVYAKLRELKGEKVNDLLIHRVNTNKLLMDSQSIVQDSGLEVNQIVKTCTQYLKIIVDTVEEFHKTGSENLFRGNPSSILCNKKYCAYYDECKYRSM